MTRTRKEENGQEGFQLSAAYQRRSWAIIAFGHAFLLFPVKLAGKPIRGRSDYSRLRLGRVTAVSSVKSGGDPMKLIAPLLSRLCLFALSVQLSSFSSGCLPRVAAKQRSSEGVRLGMASVGKMQDARCVGREQRTARRVDPASSISIYCTALCCAVRLIGAAGPRESDEVGGCGCVDFLCSVLQSGSLPAL